MICPNCGTETKVIAGPMGKFYRCRTCPFGTPVETGTHKITEMFAFVADTNGSEGLIAVELNGVVMSAVCTDRNMLETLSPIIKRTASVSKIKVKLVHFTVRKDLKTFE